MTAVRRRRGPWTEEGRRKRLDDFSTLDCYVKHGPILFLHDVKALMALA